jgi:hypothetical protein
MSLQTTSPSWGECRLDRKNIPISCKKGQEGTKVGGACAGAWGESKNDARQPRTQGLFGRSLAYFHHAPLFY